MILSNDQIFLSDADYSERVVRRTLYWYSKYSEWTLEKRDGGYVVSVSNFNPDNVAHFSRLLNDQVLREKIDSRTGHLREKIIQKVLSDLSR